VQLTWRNKMKTQSTNIVLSIAFAFASIGASTLASAQLVAYEQEGFQGRSLTTNENIANFKRKGFNDRASSAIVLRDRWEVCEDVRFGGRCVVLRPGRYASLSAMGLNNDVSSVRAVSYGTQFEDDRYAPAPVMVYDNYRRNNERTFEAQVVSVRAVMGNDSRRCWIERENVTGYRDNKTDVGGAIAGALIGGILGHQIGDGRGRDLATVAGVVAGASVGGNSDRNINGERRYTQNVQRCSGGQYSNQPAYWDVIYEFRGVEHRMQTTYPPGNTVTVNRRGLPRA
jgi:uncharacterized protein YcfJ